MNVSEGLSLEEKEQTMHHRTLALYIIQGVEKGKGSPWEKEKETP